MQNDACLSNARCGVTRAECYLTRRSFGNKIAENKYIHMHGCIKNIIRILRKVACAISAAWALLHAAVGELMFYERQ
jgi:hypothetical protein